MIPHGNADSTDWATEFIADLNRGMHVHRGSFLTDVEHRVLTNYAEQWFANALKTGAATCGTVDRAVTETEEEFEAEVFALERENQHLKQVRDLQAELIDSYKLLIEQLQRG